MSGGTCLYAHTFLVGSLGRDNRVQCVRCRTRIRDAAAGGSKTDRSCICANASLPRQSLVRHMHGDACCRARITQLASMTVQCTHANLAAASIGTDLAGLNVAEAQLKLQARVVCSCDCPACTQCTLPLALFGGTQVGTIVCAPKML